MKISLAWIFDHIKADWRDLDIPELVDKFNKTTAEIEFFQKVSVDLAKLYLAQIKSINKGKVILSSGQLKKDVVLPMRDDAALGQFYMIKKKNKSYAWACLEDFNCAKEGFVPALCCEEGLRSGGWKDDFEAEDYILEIDNKSITHRPDMWCHRGFAREMAAILDLPFKGLDEFLIRKKIIEYDNHAPKTETNLFDIKIKHTKIIKRFAGLYFPNIKNRESSLWMASRVMRVGSRPINAVVDLTNYIMLDIGQPMHAFDADMIPGKKIVVSRASKKQKIALLDDDEVELTADDIVITDGKDPISLAGIMGGKDTAIDDQTTAIFLESANFDAPIIRNTTMRLKKRTESSARFEKSLDPNQNIQAIFRFLKLLEDEGISHKVENEIASLGKRAQEHDILIEHDFIEKCLGISLDSKFVVKTFKKLEFKVVSSKKGGKINYSVTIPTFRSTKDVRIEEDLVEEIGRFFGYENIPHQLPKRITKPFDISQILKLRRIKRVLAYGMKMHQARNYPFYDESFLRILKWEPENAVAVQNPVSENWCRLVTSLVPHLIRSVEKNVAKCDQLRFFEWGRIWETADPKKEKKSLAGIFFNAKEQVDFYESKHLLTSLFDLLDIDIKWTKFKKGKKKTEIPWFYPYQTAKFMVGNLCIGMAGKLDPTFLSNVVEGDAFAFELNGEFLLSHKPSVKVFKPIGKYPVVERDISILVPLSVTVEDVANIIKSCDKKIVAVSLVDFFQKREWKDQKSLTFRFVLQDYKKTLTKDEVDHVYDSASSALKKLGAILR